MKKLHTIGRSSRRVPKHYQQALSEFPFVKKELVKRAVVVCHRLADVDAYCSAYGVVNILRGINKGISVSILTPGGLSIPAKRVRDKYPIKQYKKTDFANVDLIVVVDTGNLELLGDFIEAFVNSKSVKVFVDHHPLSNSIVDVADHIILDESVTSASEIIYNLITALNLNFNKKVYQVLLTGVFFDSQHLRLANTRTIKNVSEICRYGASISGTLDLLNSPRDISERIARLKGAQRVSYYRLGKWVLGITEIGSYHSAVAKALVDLGADIAIATSRIKDAERRVCLRSTQLFFKETNLHLGSDIAERTATSLSGFGGGHPTAASFTVSCDLEMALKLVKKGIEDGTGHTLSKLV